MSNRSPFRLDRGAAIEAILYVANRISGPDFFRISKVLYFADLAHLQRYGRFIFGDEYIAMKNGPVPSAAYDFMKRPELLSDTDRPFKVQGKHDIVPLRQADLNYFSDSDRECLDIAIAEFGDMDWRELWRRSHDQAHAATERDKAINIRDIVEMMPNRDGLLQYLELDEAYV